ncbi:hypothetical protein AR546_11440 [Leptospira interrogans serovar Canicola]|nr:hypothetical protein B2G47_04495 [Leptospira interrogans serovar Canicola]EKR38105.1 hypothetical protein LEP1GSC096_0812 [Leptospira interrogans serovar Hebdomadis str. R499]EMK20219.1 hypothetical protein LEP1GSC075_1164 [Leptospira interrogans str. Kito]EMN74596.1 hypothetical protein LEP1GSC102_3736 [Leptospira interrogans str. UI 09600]OLZ31238.1 hypothetical protein AR546_11440 [Leptospira interrogans serovar Canicola]
MKTTINRIKKNEYSKFIIYFKALGTQTTVTNSKMIDFKDLEQIQNLSGKYNSNLSKVRKAPTILLPLLQNRFHI